MKAKIIKAHAKTAIYATYVKPFLREISLSLRHVLSVIEFTIAILEI